MNVSPRRPLAALALLALLTLFLAPSVGLEWISPRHWLEPAAASQAAAALWRFRLPRVLLGFMAGAVFAGSGLICQALFRNPLATEATLGIGAGAALGATLQLRLAAAAGGALLFGAAPAAMLGAAGALALVWGMTRAAGRRAGAGTLLLAGIAVGIFCSSVILLLQTTNDFYNSFRLLRWLMGGLSAVDYGAVARLAPAALLGLIPALALTREMNLLLTGEDLAAARGVHVARVKGWLIGVTAVWIGGAVAACGPIGFLGLLTPHIMRRLVGADHRRLLPATLLGGGILLTVCDALARRIIAPAEMPVGAITALLGGPFFGLLLICDRAPGDAASS